jgi:nucleotide-binding universal stress UspA family protein
MFKRILVPVDGSDASTKALVSALQLARESGGNVRVVHVFDELSYLSGYEYAAAVAEQAREQAQQALDDALAVCQSSGVPADAKLLDTPGRRRLGDAVADAAREFGADLVAIGSHGRRGLDRLLLGSGAEQILRLAQAPVLVVK